MPNHTEPVTINGNGSCVLETNWDLEAGHARCQMIWQALPGGGCRITTCRPDVDPIVLTSEHCAALAGWLRGEHRNGTVHG